MALHLTIAALKGGVGKSTTTLNLATCLHRDGHRVLIVDSDKQGTCAAWAEAAARAGQPGPPVVAVSGDALRRDLPTLAAGYDVVVIDSPPYAGPAARAAMLAADMIVIPTTPGAADAWALQATLDVLAEVRSLRPEIRAAVLLNRADRTRLTAAVREAVAALGLPLLGAELGVRVALGEATLAGQGVVTYAPTSPAAREVEQVTAAVLAALQGTNGQAARNSEPHPTTTPTAATDAAPDARARGQGERATPRARGARKRARGAADNSGQLAIPDAPPSSRRTGTSAGRAIHDPARVESPDIHPGTDAADGPTRGGRRGARKR